MAAHPSLAFRFDCGATWLNLLATRGSAFGAHPAERLATPALLAEWLDRSELAPRTAPAQADLEEAWRLRELLRSVALPTAAGQTPPAEAVAELSAYLARREEPLRLRLGDRLVREGPATAAAALGRIARQAAEHLTGPERHALKICPESDCRGLFTDAGGRRRWCPSPACASRGRVRAHRARRGATPPPAPTG
ncbi:CGNR zinc finger domain-containing protein [Streptomyces hoynatensis]|uniref:Zinc finger CGNR domain-containing protein n=1 Tax=Streptomyces hoynatensis TaxID=1141874 RepID=A0A3A9Z941_9ACTN|nr:ABATE domain-containing protein [Streptomyces hoynatensis]RKN44962.1 hypothetical protein D7294_07605 [Streptomyces hoynatensis]